MQKLKPRHFEDRDGLPNQDPEEPGRYTKGRRFPEENKMEDKNVTEEARDNNPTAEVPQQEETHVQEETEEQGQQEPEQDEQEQNTKSDHSEQEEEKS
jgi:hypothetical protein